MPAILTTAQIIATELRVAELVASLREAHPLDYIWREPETLKREPDGEHPAAEFVRHLTEGAKACVATADEVFTACTASRGHRQQVSETS